MLYTQGLRERELQTLMLKRLCVVSYIDVRISYNSYVEREGGRTQLRQDSTGR